MHNISFPNIGINDLHVKRVVFTLFGRDIYWYGLLITSAIILAYLIVCYNGKKEHIKSDDITDLALYVVIFGIVGARLYYVLTSLDKYNNIWDAFKIWEGGIAFYGCVLGGTAAVLAYSLLKKKKFTVLTDMIAPTLLISQAIGRWGNFFNAEAYGSVTQWDFFGRIFDISGSTELPWIMTINGTYVMPTFLYECIWNLIGFVLLMIWYNRKSFNGQISLMYIVWYGSIRAIVEGFRTDSLYIGSIRISQLIGAVSAAVGLMLLIMFNVMAKKNKLAKPFDFESEETIHTEGEEENGSNN